MYINVFVRTACLILFLCLTNLIYGQGDSYCTSTSISVGSSCITEAGSTTGFDSDSEFDSSCSGTETAEGWYWITGGVDGTNYTVELTGATGDDFVISVVGVTGATCTSPVEIDCVDATGSGGTETITFTWDNTIYDYYYVQMYEWWGGDGDFDICVYGGSSSTCSLSSAGLTNIGCDSNSTPDDDTDDIIEFELDPTGSNLGSGYSITVSSGTVSPTTGSYGAATGFSMDAGSAGGGDITVTITDNDDPTCTIDVDVTDPGPCSGSSDNCSGDEAAADDCIDAPLVSFDQPYVGSTDCGFTVDEPYSGYGTGGDWCGTLENNSWISFIAAEETLEFDVTVEDIDGSSGDPWWTCDTGVQFSLWEGDCGNLSLVDGVCENPGSDPNVGETNNFELTGMIPGNTYYLMVDGYAGEECNYTLDPGDGIVVCDNDLCGDAIEIQCDNPNIINGLQCATSDDSDSDCNGAGFTNAGTWYYFQGNDQEITLSVDNDATDFSARIHVYEGTCGSKTCVAGATGNGTNEVIFTANSGTTYYICIDGDAGDIGIFELSIACSISCVQDAGTFDVAIDGVDQGSSCGTFDLDSQSEITWTSNGDQNVGPGANAGIVFVIFDTDPSVFDLTDPDTFNPGLNSNVLGGDPDNTAPYTTEETNCAGLSGTDDTWPTTVWVVPVTADFASIPYTIDTDFDGCVDAGCITQLNYIYTDEFTLGCGDTFTDTGGTGGDYCNNENTSWLICPDDPSEPVTVTFSSFETEGIITCYDELEVFDGDSDSAPSLGGFCEPGLGPFTSSHSSGCLYFVFTSDGSGTEFGWEASISCSGPPCTCEDPICGGMHWDCVSEAEDDYNDFSSTAAQYDIDPDIVVSNGSTYELCWDYTTGADETSVGFVHALGYEYDGFSDECTFDRIYHVYESGCGTEISSTGSAAFGTDGQEYDLSANTTYSFCVEITITNSDCLTIADTWVYLYNADNGGGCGTCSTPCTETGMGMADTYDDRSWNPSGVPDPGSCWTPDCPIEGPEIVTNCWEAVADATGFLGFANIVDDGSTLCLPGDIDISWELQAEGDCGNVITPDVDNANGVSSGFNPEYSGLTANGTYVICITYDIPGGIFDCGLDQVCTEYYGTDCDASLDGTSMDGFACKDDSRSLEAITNWVENSSSGAVLIGFVVFCDPPTTPLTEAYYDANALDAILETTDNIGDFINTSGQYEDPISGETCDDEIYLIPITVESVDGGGNFIINWDCYATEEVIQVDLGVSPMADVVASSNPICTGDDVDLTASGGGTYEWSDGLGTNATVTVSPTSTMTYTVTVTDDSGNCTSTAQIEVEVSEIDASVTNIMCDNNGTPSDPSDDTFTFDVTVTGTNTGSTWTANDSGSTSGSYGIAVSFGPYNISDGSISFTITDDGGAGCTTTVMVDPPSTCSDECEIDASVLNIVCNNNGTPSDDSDDTYTFDINVTGTNTGASWTADDPNGESGAYGVNVSFGPFNISDGVLTFTVTDIDDSGCTYEVMVTPPSTCSNTCSISHTVANIVCDDNGTPSDPSDDTYSFEITVTGMNTGASWSADDPNGTSGLYGVSTSFGPYDISDGDLSFTITDVDDNGCTTSVMVTAPGTCSDECDIDHSVVNIVCDDNGTPSDPSDDTFTFEVTVTGSNTGASWMANDPNGTSGSYGVSTSFGPYDISDGDLNFTITDINDSGCTTSVMVTAPGTCSDECDIDHSVVNIICDDNGTPSDPSDDTFTFEVTVTGSNTGSGWSASDPNGTSGSYGVSVTFGPYDISGGDLSFTITDVDDNGCTTSVMVTAPGTCSDECDIDASVVNIVCDDNGTPSDPSDDTYSFEVTVTGSNTGSGWSASDPNGTSGSYGVSVTFGPYDISGGDLSFTITDNSDAGCTTTVMVDPPSTCSDECEIDASVLNIVCNNNGTPSDDSDDTYTFDINVTGANTGASWTADDPNGESGAYGVNVGFGPFNIGDGVLTFTVTDIDDSGCTYEVMVTPPSTCSNTCSISHTVANIVCDDNGTPSDPSDDTFTFEITVTGMNTGASWSADDPNGTSGLYGVSTSFGPYDIGDGDLSFTITDVDDAGCTTTVMVDPPSTCSDECDIDASVVNIVCDDNGTPSDPSDDTFTFEVTVTGSNTGASWTANDPNGTSGSYGVSTSFGPYDISDGDLNFTITDINDSGCTTSVMVTAPGTCSDECDIDHSVVNIVCDDNGTPSDPSDDTFTFEITVTGMNTGASWSADDPNSTSGSYGVSTTFGPYDISDGDLSFTITDVDDAGCTTSVMVTAPGTCSDECDIEASVVNIVCDDNGTPSDPSDDTYSFEVTVTGSNTGSGWSASDPNGTSGSYGVSVTFGPYDISGGDLSFTITDNSDAGCTTSVMVTAPDVCSNECDIDAVFSNVICNDNGTPSDPDDDTYTFDVLVTGSNTGSGWSADDPNGESGAYGVNVSFGPFDIANGNITITITDDDNPGCTTTFTVTAPNTCSGTCSIGHVVSNIVCDDNGTPSDPSDDTYTFEILVTGSNIGGGWTADDPNSSSGLYGVTETLGPYNIADGNLNFTITDDTDPACTTIVGVVPPGTCSDECDIDASVVNIVCDDNGTPSDPSDDTFTFEVTVTGSNTGASWTANDPNGTSGSYGVSTSFGPYDISDGDLNFTITDINDSGCTTTVMVDPPSTCSDECDIDHSVVNIICDDNGTPSDPSDDTFTFEVTVTGSNTGSGWSASDPNGTSGSYGVSVTFGPYDISGGDLSFTITDVDDSGCTTSAMVTAPGTCSDECDIEASVVNIVCDDNGTPSDPSDDTYSFEVTVTGSNTGSGWSASDPNGTSGSYGVSVTFGPYDISGGDLSFTITDNSDAGCTTSVMVTAPDACSNECDIDAVFTNIMCDDNGTPSDPDDDTFTFEVMVSGSNTGASWTANDPLSTSGAYDVFVSFGPYLISDGNVSLLITDDGDASCITNITIIAPSPCSGTCSISNTISNIVCDDNGTPSDPSDDVFFFDVLVSGSNTGGGWTADDPNATSGMYDIVTTFGPYLISDGTLNFTITDDDDSGCTTIVSAVPPMSCSDECEISADVTNILCDDNGTPNDPSDDTYTFEVTVTGNNASNSWVSDDPNGTSGSYNTVIIFGPYLISDGNLSFSITDANDNGCTATANVTAPSTCSEECVIDAAVSNVLCDDNGTPSDPSDDTYSFEVEVTGNNTGASWTADDPNGTSGVYNSIVVFGPYLISNGDLNVTITDLVDSNCSTLIEITAPMSCSDACVIDAIVNNVLCNDNGTPSDSSDDTFTFEVTVSGSNTGGGWNANDPNGTSGNYNVVTVFGPYLISGGDVNFSITDINDSGCTTGVMVTAPMSCSDACEISATFTNILCNDNGTPSDPTDDTFTFEVEVTGTNTGGGWSANDPNSTSGDYNEVVVFGPYDIVNGNLNIQITDDSEGTCTTNINIIAPNACSGTCSIGNALSNIVCNDNGTPSDPSDDTFTFEIVVSGSNTGVTWTANDPNSTSGNYNEVVVFGPYNISDGNFNFTISDVDDISCSTNVQITAPATCSDTCDITVDVMNVICDDGGTSSDAGDDAYTFEVLVNGSNTGSSWTASDPNNTSGSYNTVVVFGPYLISDGDLDFDIVDGLDGGCIDNVMVSAPPSCSDACDIQMVVTNVICDDNGTPADPSDDIYTFDVEVSGSNTGGSWTANDPNSTSGNYNEVVSFGPYAISDGDISLVITDIIDNSCTTMELVMAPSTCSPPCDIGYMVSNVVCDDNGTPTDPSDDTFSYDIIVTGSNVGSGWSANDPLNSTGIYNTTINLGPYPVSGGDLQFIITDNTMSDCTIDVNVVSPGTCSGDCDINSTLSNIQCDDNGTPSDPSDDTFTFDVEVTGNNMGAGWIADDINNTNGGYDVVVNFGPYSINGGDLNILIMDETDMGCTTTVSVEAPSPCSENNCMISVEELSVNDVTCYEGSDGSIELMVNGAVGNLDIEWSDSSLSDLSEEELEAGIYKVTITDDAGCIDSLSIEIGSPDEIITTYEIKNVPCSEENGGEIEIKETSGGSGDYSYSINGGEFEDVSLFEGLEAGMYSIEVMDGSGCVVTDEIEVLGSDDSWTIGLTASSDEIELGDELTLFGVTSLDDTEIQSIVWSPDTGFDFTEGDLSPSLMPSQSDTYMLTIQDINGCEKTATVLVLLRKVTEIELPNIFSPGDGDNVNSSFFPSANTDQFEVIDEMMVFDRWGNLVFKNENFGPNNPNEGWDGKFNGDKASQGVYVYFLRTKDMTGEEVILKGDITLLR